MTLFLLQLVLGQLVYFLGYYSYFKSMYLSPPPEGAQVQALHRLDDEMDQVILRDPIPQVRRQQQRLISIDGYESCAHAQSIP